MNLHLTLATSTLLLIFASAAPPASARAPRLGPRVVDVRLDCERGRCEDIWHRGQRYVAGEWGQRYAVVVSNPSDRWIEAVVTVDGRNVLDGRRPHAGSRGYLVPPRDRIEIEGWRTSTEAVAAFRFTSVADSYAGRVGDPRDAGTVRVDVYFELQRRVYIPEPRPWRADRGGEGRAGAPEVAARDGHGAVWDDRRHRRPGGQNLGTQYGESRWQPVQERQFVRETARPAQTLTLRYDDRAGLRARGILGPPPMWRPDEQPMWRGDDRWVPPPP